MKSIRLEVPNAILFVFDPNNKSVEIPRYSTGELVSSNNTCVSIGTQANIDGSVLVSIGRPDTLDTEAGLQTVFRGFVHTPNRTLAVVSSENSILLEVDTKKTNAEIEIFVDDLSSPSSVWLIVDPA